MSPRTKLWALLPLLLLAPLQAEEIYRWRDADGQLHFSDTPPANRAEPTRVQLEWRRPLYRIKHVFDGDTVTLHDDRRVRLIGLDAPEIPHHGRPGEPGGEAAREYLQQLVDGQKVELEFDAERKDRYGRLLAHLTLEDGTNLSAALLSAGHGHAMAKPPNLKHIEEYFSAEAQARRHRLGVWAGERFAPRPVGSAAELRNSFQRLAGKLQRVEERKNGTLRLHFPGRFYAEIPAATRPLFEPNLANLSGLIGKEIIIRGWIRQSRGAPLIRLAHPLQIETIR